MLGDRDNVKALVDDIQHITVSCDLLLISVPGRGFFLHKLLDAGAGGNDALDGVRLLCSVS